MRAPRREGGGTAHRRRAWFDIGALNRGSLIGQSGFQIPCNVLSGIVCQKGKTLSVYPEFHLTSAVLPSP